MKNNHLPHRRLRTILLRGSLASLSIPSVALAQTSLTEQDLKDYTDPTPLTISGGTVVNTETESSDALRDYSGTPSLDSAFIVAVKTEGDINIGSPIDNIAQSDEGSISITNTSLTDGGAIGLWNAGASIGALEGKFIVDSEADSRAIFMSGGAISSIKGEVTATSDGTSGAIIVEGGRIESITGAKITATSRGDFASAVGLEFSTAGVTDATAGDINATIVVNTVGGQGSVIVSSAPSNLGKISGSYTIDASANVSFPVFSIGYLLGDQASSTTTSLAFKNTSTAGGSSGRNDSFDFDIDWANIKLTVKRNNQFAAGVTLIGQDASAETSPTFYLGAASDITAESVANGNVVGIWLNGSTGGNIEGDVIATVGTGTSYGIATVGTDTVGPLITQSRANSTLGDITGTITSTVKTSGTAYGLLIGDSVQVNNDSVATDFTTTMGTISGSITASAESSDAGNAVGIKDISSNALKLAGGATITATITTTSTTGDTTVVSTAHGTAILNTVAGISLSSADSSVANAVQINGNLNAGEQSLEFTTGSYEISSSRWDATASISMGAEGATPTADYTTASVTTSDILTASTETMNFYVNSVSDVSTLIVGDAQTLNLEGLTTVNIYLKGELADYEGNLPVYLLDAREAESFNWDTGDDIVYQLYLNNVLLEQDINFYVQHDSTGISIIPEPTTATMSLIALASLLQRRRRRARQ